MNADQVKAVIAALREGNADAALSILEELLVTMVTGEEPADPVEDPAVTDPAPDPAADSAAASTDTPPELMAANKRADAAELEVRRMLIPQLIALRAETPATAWKDASKLIPSDRLTGESTVSIRARITALSASAPAGNRPPARGPTEAPTVVTLTESQKRLAKKRGWTDAETLEQLSKAVRKLA